MKLTRTLILVCVFLMSLGKLSAQNVDVDVNLNIVHSVDGVSDFGRERHIGVHASVTEDDWIGVEDEMDYLVNDLDMHFGRDNGLATFCFNQTPEDEENPHNPDLKWMEELGAASMKERYDARIFSRQYEDQVTNMIMGTNPHPTYPTFHFYGKGTTDTGWDVHTIEASANWVEQYLDNYFEKSSDGSGQPLPKYWEVVNEIDMLMMDTGEDACYTSPEKTWEYHNLVAKQVRARLGEKSPLIGGYTWGLHDFFWQNKNSGDMETIKGWLGENAYMADSRVYPYKNEKWYQWDVLWQGFVDSCGTNMDFYGIHIYDWPAWEGTAIRERAGGHTEAMLDMIECYDHHRFNGERKPIVISEYGAVSDGLKTLESRANYKRRDWENLKPFNSMLMQFLERPGHIEATLPFITAKATWGDIYDDGGNLTERYAFTLFDYDENGNWFWTELVKFYQLWSDVDGTRIDTKSSKRDVQVDAYVDGNHMYLILNNLNPTEETINLHFFDDYANGVESVHYKHLYLDETLGIDGEPVLDDRILATAPGSVVLDGYGTIILDYAFENAVMLDQTSVETKTMGARLGSGTNMVGGDLMRETVGTTGSLESSINGVSVPSVGEAVLRIGGYFHNMDATIPSYIRVNGNDLDLSDPDWRGSTLYTDNIWFGVIEIDVPTEYLASNNSIEVGPVGNNVDYTSLQMQVWDFSKAPGRSQQDDAVGVTGIDLIGSYTLTAGEKGALAASVAPTNATNKTISWSSSAPSVVSVDEFGAVTALAAGSANITATSVDGNFTASCAVTVNPYTTVPLSSATISEGTAITLEQGVMTPLSLNLSPADASIQSVVWSSSDELVAPVGESSGKVYGIAIGETATITALVTDEYGNIRTATTEVTVGIYGQESISCGDIPENATGETSYAFSVPVNVNGTREVEVQFLSGQQVLGSSTEQVETLGVSTVYTTVDLASVPADGSDYSVKTILRSGSTVIDECEAPIEILPPIAPESITFMDWLWEVDINGQLQIVAAVLPEDAFNKSLTWESSNPGVASVDANGLVTGLSYGTTTITARAVDGGVTQSVNIEVKDVYVVADSIKLLSVVNVFPGATHEIQVAYYPAWTTEKDLTWSISDPTVASVSSGNTITVHGAEGASTSIQGVYAANSQFTVSSEIQVVSSLYIEAEDFTTQGGSGEIDIYTSPSGQVAVNDWRMLDYLEYPIYIPATGTYNFTFYAGTLVDDGVIGLIVDGVTMGKVQVTPNDWDTFEPRVISGVALDAGGHTFRVRGVGTSGWQFNLEHFEIALGGSIDTIHVENISVAPTTAQLSISQSTQLVATVSPADATVKTLTWESSNPSAVSVSNTGVITGLAQATGVIITATSVDGGHTAQCVVNVSKEDVTGVELSESAITLGEGGSTTLIATVLPTNATNQNVTWASLNPAVATVSQNGLVTGVVEGTTEVTVTTEEGGFVARCDVEVEGPIDPESVTLNLETGDLTIGQLVQLNAIVLPAEATNKTVSWYSLNPTIASVDQNGLVQALAEGVATIEVSTVVGGHTDSYTCAITAPEVGDTIVIEAETFTSTTGTIDDGAWGGPGLGVNNNGSAINWVNSGDEAGYSFEVGTTGEYLIEYLISTPEDNAQIQMTVGGSIVATDDVPKNGSWDAYTTLASASTVNLTAGTENMVLIASGSNAWQWNLDKVLLIRKIIDEPIAVDSVTLDVEELSFTTENASQQLVATIHPADADNQTISWRTSNPAVATVANGLVTALGNGSAVITGTTADGSHTASCDVNVAIAVDGITVDPTSITLTEAGATRQIIATITPASAANTAVNWESSDIEVATVDANGLVSAVAQGTAEITATTVDGGFVASTLVRVTTFIPVTDVSITASLTLTEGQSTTLTATVTPDDATDPSLSWRSEDGTIASVDANGFIQALSKGVVNIIATSTSNPEVSATCVLTVRELQEPQGDTIIIEAESFTATTGTFDDSQYGGSGLGVNSNGSAINYVNSGDEANYQIEVATAGNYAIEYQISTPMSNAQVQLEIGGVVVSTDEVVNNGSWDNYAALEASGTAYLTIGSHDVTLIASGSNTWQWNLDKIILRLISDIAVESINIVEASVELNQGESQSLNIEVNPSNATNQAVSWDSDAPGIATVDDNGNVTAISEGVATITATAVDGGATDNCTVTVNGEQPVVLAVEAEDYVLTGGAYNGFEVYTVGDAQGINWNQTGDWGDYDVDVSVAGSYRVEYIIGTAITGGAVEFILNGVSIMTDDVPNYNNWDEFATLQASQEVNLDAGTQSIRLQGAGTHGWEWNLDKFMLRRTGDQKGANDMMNSAPLTVNVYPNPVADELNIRVSAQLEENAQLIIMSSTGDVVIQEKITERLHHLATGSLTSGLYVMRVINGTETVTSRFIRK